MAPLKVSSDIVPLADFKAQAAALLRRLNETDSPMVITQNGRAAAVMLSPEAYDALLAADAFTIASEQGTQDLDSGRFVEGERVTEWLDSWATANELPAPRPRG